MVLGRFFFSLKLVGLSLLVMSALRLLFFVLYFAQFEHLSISQILFSFVNGLRFDLSILMTFTGVVLLMLNVPFKPLNRGWIKGFSYLFLGISVVLFLVIVGDIVYFDLVKRHLANELLLLEDDVGYIVEMATHYVWAILFFIFFTVLLVGIFKRLIQGALGTASWTQVLLVILFVVLSMRGNVSTGKAINVIDAYGAGNKAMGNLALNGAFTAYHFSRASGKFHTPKFYDTQELYAFMDKNATQRFPYATHVTPQQKPKNIIFFLLESWSAKYMGALGATYGVTPNFDALAQEGALYTRFYASGQRSIQGIQAVLTSIPPFAGLPSLGFGLEVYGHSRVADMARAQGYETFFFQSSLRRSFRMDAIAHALGFDHYFGMEDMPLRLDYEVEPPKFGWDYETLMFMYDTIKEVKTPFFSFVFTGTTHVPYAQVPKAHQKYPHDALGETGFLNTLSYADWALGAFMQEAKKAPWFKDTIFIFTADHALGSFESRGFVSQFHIPLLVIDGGNLHAARVDTVASQLDLMPTLVSLTGFKEPFSAFGTHLEDPKPKSAMVSMASSIGLIDAQGHIVHSLKQRLETSFTPVLANLKEQELLGGYQIVNELLHANRWAPK